MENNIKINFENFLNKKNFSSSQKEIKESNFNNFIKNGFPNKRIEDWKFSDLKQIITTNFENIDFSKKEEQSIFEIIPSIKTILLCSRSNVKLASILVCSSFFEKSIFSKLVVIIFFKSENFQSSILLLGNPFLIKLLKFISFISF